MIHKDVNGVQTLYAELHASYVVCGKSVQSSLAYFNSRCRIGGIEETETLVSLQNWKYKSG